MWLRRLFIFLSMLIVGMAIGYFYPHPTTTTQNQADSVPLYPIAVFPGGGASAGGSLPANWPTAFNESPPIIDSLSDLKQSDAQVLVEAPRQSICFSGGCDYSTLAIFIVKADAMNKFIAQAKASVQFFKDSGLGDTWQTEKIGSTDVDVAIQNNIEDKYPGMKTYFLFGNAPTVDTGNTEMIEIGYVVRMLRGGVAEPEQKDLDYFIQSVQLDLVPHMSLPNVFNPG